MKTKTKKAPAKGIKKTTGKPKSKESAGKAKESDTSKMKKVKAKTAARSKARHKVASSKNKNDERSKNSGKNIVRAHSSSANKGRRGKNVKTAGIKKTSVSEKKAGNKVNQPLAVQIPHGRDQHFIPAHKNEVYMPVRDSKKSEKLFHHKEEVALNQENQKVKAEAASAMSRKKILRIPGR
jgi:hypothetical protein